MKKAQIVFITLPLNGKFTDQQVQNVQGVLKSMNLNIGLVFTGPNSEGLFSQTTTEKIFEGICPSEKIIVTESLTPTGQFTSLNLTDICRNDDACIENIVSLADAYLIQNTSTTLSTLLAAEKTMGSDECICVCGDFIQINAMLHVWPQDEGRIENIDGYALVRIGDVAKRESDLSFMATSAAFAKVA